MAVRVLLLSRGDIDIEYYLNVRRMIRGRFPEADVLIICSEQNPQLIGRHDDVLYCCRGLYDAEMRLLVDERVIAESEAALPPAFPRNLFRSDPRCLYGTFSDAECAAEQALIVRAALDVFRDFKPHLAYGQGGTPYLLHTIVHNLGHFLGVPSYRTVYTPFLQYDGDSLDRVWLPHHPHLHLDASNQFGHDRDAVREHVEKVLEIIRGRRHILANSSYRYRSKYSSIRPRSIIKDVVNIVRLRRKISSRAAPDFLRHDEMRLAMARNRLRTAANYYRNRRLITPMDSLGGPFVLFPLNLVYDSTITLMAPQFRDPFTACEMVARALPHGYLLAIREHPVMPGMLDHGRLKAMLRDHPNIRLVDCDVPFMDMVLASQAMVTVSSTSTLEALCADKPVLMLGDGYLTDTGCVYQAKNLLHLGNAVAETLSDPQRGARAALLQRALENALLETWPAPNTPTLSGAERRNRADEALLEKISHLVERAGDQAVP